MLHDAALPLLLALSAATGPDVTDLTGRYPRGTHAVVFDIDGTCTLSDQEYIEQLRSVFYVPIPWPHADEVTQAYAAHGYLVIYITGRPQIAQAMSLLWLHGMGFAGGPVKLAQTARDSWPSNAGVGTFKARYLQYLRGIGIIVDYAYGNAPSDVYAYALAGLDRRRTYIVGPHAGMGGTVALRNGYAAHLATVQALPDVTQPLMALGRSAQQ